MKKLSNINGFTLIELIGVMAVIAILAATIAPGIIRDIDRSLGEAEQTQLYTLAKELETYISMNKGIPDASNWATELASIGSLPSNKISENKRFYARAYYVDPQFFTSTATAFSQYTQTGGIATRPFSPRIIIASNLKGTLPTSITSAADFEDVWSQASGASIIESDDVKIQRVNLQGFFHRVLLTNSNTTDIPGYQLETGTTQSTGTLTTEFYVLKDTKLNLIDGPFTSNVIGQAVLVNNAISFSYTDVSGVWQWQSL